MKGAKKHNFILILMALVMLVLGVSAQPAEAQTTTNCLPSCDTTDARFLALAGSGLSTFVDDSIAVEFAAPSGSTSLEIAIFDGDTSGTWDYGANSTQYSLYADPEGDGVGTSLVIQWSGVSMPDNAWFEFSVTPSEAARAPSGHYFYSLVISNLDPSATSLNSFKIRTTGVATMKPQTIPFVATLISQADVNIVYAGPTPTYDGTWNFHLYVPTTTDTFEMWDGDLDFGSYDLSTMDTDDPDTPNDFIPAWAAGTVVTYEGVAVGYNGATGSPADDTSFQLYRRSPSVIYEIVDPNGVVFANANPSGDKEWEQFLISSNNTILADYYTQNLLPQGIYELNVSGVDMTNLNAWYFPYEVICEDQYGNACTPLFPFEMGDTVWYDDNGNAIQDAGELGIAGVLVELLDANGVVVASTLTDSNGYYSFGVYAGVYALEVAAGNFEAGGPLEGMVVTTVSEHLDAEIVDASEMNCDFGFHNAPPPAPGVGTPSYWKNNPQAWPVEQITIGGKIFTKSQAIQLLGLPTNNDMRIPFAKELIAAKLNVLIGNDSSCITATITAADNWLVQQGFGSYGVVLSGSPAWKQGEPLYNKLRDYNRGLLCAPSM